jgi:hypothetical protein
VDRVGESREEHLHDVHPLLGRAPIGDRLEVEDFEDHQNLEAASQGFQNSLELSDLRDKVIARVLAQCMQVVKLKCK